jgi:uncharacterized protein
MASFNTEYIILFYLFLLVIAFFYSSIGHGGASGYLALMVLFSFSITSLKINALILNCFVSLISFLFFTKSKKFNLILFTPFAITSIPASFLGGYLDIPQDLLELILGAILILSVLYINGFFNQKEIEPKPIRESLAVLFGLIIGLFSGMIGIGGGIMLTPVLLIMGWATIGEAASISALFIFANSLAGILGYLIKGNSLEVIKIEMIPVAVLGGILGSYLGSHYFSNRLLKTTLSIVVIVASIKLIIP